MKLHLPLYARILGLFLLNILVIAGAFLIVFRMQFQLGLDSVLAGQANRRVQALSQAVIGELQQAPASEIDGVIRRFSQAFELDVYVFQSGGKQVAGESVTLPAEVEQRIRRQGAGRRRSGVAGQGMRQQRGPRFGQQQSPDGGRNSDQRPPPQDPLEPPEPGQPDFRPEPFDGGLARDGAGMPEPRWQERRGRSLPLASFFIKSTEPKRFWAGTFFPSRQPANEGRPHVLLIVSDSITGGGLFFDFTPWIVAGCAGLVLSALIWLPFVRSITRSLAQMTRTTGEISVGRFDARVPSRRHDELGRLAEAINDMAGRLEGFVGGQRRFLGDIAHELCSPLARIQTALGILEQRATDADQAYVKDLQEEAEHMSHLVGELLSFSKASIDQSKVHLEATSVTEVVAGAVRREQVAGETIQQSVPPDLMAHANAELLQRAVANLVRNAVRHAGSAGPIRIAGWQDGNEAVIEVADGGPGVPEESLSKLFDPFYRVDESRTRETGGVGLGMTIVKTCVESCGGTVTAINRAEGGLQVRIRLRGSM